MLSIIDDIGFNELMKFAFPNYKIPCRATITSEIEKNYNNAKQLLKDEIQKVKYVGVTTDAWTSKYTQKRFYDRHLNQAMS